MQRPYCCSGEESEENDMFEQCDVLVVGGGAAATRAAIEAARAGAKVTMVCRGAFAQSGTSPLGLHGFSSVLGENDSEATLIEDILDTGDHLNDIDLVEVAVRESRRDPARLEAMGVRFVHDADGKYDIYRGAGHSVAHGLTFDEQGHHDSFVHVLGPTAWKLGVKLVERVMIAELLVEKGRVVGAVAIDAHDGERVFGAKAVILAAGGANHAYPNIVPRIKDEKWRTTGDGYALALKAGLELVDMEMPNFRDTPPLARIKGRYVNAKGEYFMRRYDKMLENASRDVVVAALFSEMAAGNGPIYVDLPAESETISKALPQEYKDVVKAFKDGKRPTATITFQRLLGGARILPDASTALAGLCVAGENAGGFHGGDRLQGAAFLETQVFGRFAGINAAKYAAHHAPEANVMALVPEAVRRGCGRRCSASARSASGSRPASPAATPSSRWRRRTSCSSPRRWRARRWPARSPAARTGAGTTRPTGRSSHAGTPACGSTRPERWT